MNQATKRQFKAEVNSALCKECLYCVEVCEPAVFENSGLFNQAGYRYIVAKRTENCNGCMKCFTICPDFAITVEEVMDILAQPGEAASESPAASGAAAR
jgi:NAD-dependent dihydropyrimidine dehydrogenase PreA subunit